MQGGIEAELRAVHGATVLIPFASDILTGSTSFDAGRLGKFIFGLPDRRGGPGRKP
jgi:hypothetical protein